MEQWLEKTAKSKGEMVITVNYGKMAGIDG